MNLLQRVLRINRDEEDFYAEGYEDGESYRETYPDASTSTFTKAQADVEHLNREELGYAAWQNEQFGRLFDGRS